jgi:hypothetical protein
MSRGLYDTARAILVTAPGPPKAVEEGQMRIIRAGFSSFAFQNYNSGSLVSGIVISASRNDESELATAL